MDKGSLTELADEGGFSAVRSQVSVKILLCGAPLGTVHAAKLLDVAVSKNVILQSGELLEFLSTHSTRTL